MDVYLVCYITLFILAMKETLISKYSLRQTYLLCGLFIIAFSLIAGIRYGIGKDYYSYQAIFHFVRNFSDYNYLEPGFRFIISFVKLMGISEKFLFFIFAFISLFFLFIGIRKNSHSPVLSAFIFLLVFYIGYTFNAMRQGVVMSIFIFILDDIEKRKLKKVTFFTILGMTMHYSAVFILVGYFFNKIKITRKKYILMTILLFGIILTSNLWADIITGLAPGVVKAKLNLYSENFELGVDFISIMQRLLLLTPFLIYYPKLSENNEKFQGIFKLYFLGFVLYSIFSFQDTFATRVNMLFRILEIILLPYLLSININKFEKTMILFLIVCWATLTYLIELNYPFNYPFKTVFGVY